MKKYLTLLLLLLNIQLFAQELAVVGIETIYILEGTRGNKYPITMYLNIELNTETNIKKASGKYYYNNIGEFLYLRESALENTSKITLKEFTTSDDAYGNTNSTGEFSGTFSDDLVFKGTWKSVKNSFNFELKPKNNATIQEIEIKKYSFIENSNSNSERTPSFEFATETFQIKNPKKIFSIDKLNKELSKLGSFDFDDDYSSWKKIIEDGFDVSYAFITSYDFTYVDNNILSLVSHAWSYTGGAHGIGYSIPILYNIDSGKTSNEKVADLISNVEDDKLIALMRQKLKENSNQANENNFYFDFGKIRLSDNYSVDASGVTFIYNQYEIAPYSSGIISIKFTYDELKPFVKRNSELWYLFE